MRVFGLVLLLALLGCNDTAVQEENARLAGEATALKSRVEMLEALLRLERSVAPAASRAPGPRTLTLVAEKKDKSTQDRLAEEHQRAKDRGYHREFHESIKKNGGERLREEWRKFCRNRRGVNDMELNCE